MMSANDRRLRRKMSQMSAAKPFAKFGGRSRWIEAASGNPSRLRRTIRKMRSDDALTKALARVEEAVPGVMQRFFDASDESDWPASEPEVSGPPRIEAL